jgi:excisionase family DNA binding protein
MASARLVMSVTEAAELLEISRALAYELARLQRLPAVRLGRRLVVPRKALALWLDQSCGLDRSYGPFGRINLP